MVASNYEMGELIGKGAFGQVYKGIERSTGKIVALKVVDMEAYNDEIEIIQDELRYMLSLNTPYLVTYITSFMKGTQLWIVMDYIRGGCLKHLLDHEMNEGRSLSETVIASVIHDVLRGLVYLHSEGRCHQDVKAANILLDADGTAKLADVLLAGYLMQSTRQKSTVVVSPYWLAPEVIQETTYDEKSDIWSLGITAFELATGLPPRFEIHPMRVIFMIPYYDCPTLEGNFSPNLIDFVACCLERDPAKRPSSTALLEHPFIKHAPPSPGEVRRQLERFLSAQTMTRSNSHSTPPSNFYRINTPLVSSIGFPSLEWEFDTTFSLGEGGGPSTPLRPSISGSVSTPLRQSVSTPSRQPGVGFGERKIAQVSAAADMELLSSSFSNALRETGEELGVDVSPLEYQWDRLEMMSRGFTSVFLQSLTEKLALNDFDDVDVTYAVREVD